MSSTPARNRGLDGLRGVAVLLVVGSHLSAGRLPYGGMAGVTLFFVLSGYLITGLLLRETEVSGTVDIRAFYARRALRLLPALVVVLAATPLVLLVLDDRRVGLHLLGASMASLFYVADVVRASGDHMVVLGHTWSLAVEEQFYLLWPFLLGALSRATRASRVALFRITLGLALATVVWRLTASQLFGFDRVYFAPDTNAFGLFLGCALACRPVRLSQRVGTAVVGVAGLLLVLLAVGPGITDGRYQAVLMFGAVPAGLVGVLAVIGAQNARFVGLPPLVFFGRISYGLYLWHGVLLLSTPGGAPLFAARDRGLAVLVSIALATTSFYLVENPALRAKRRFERASVTDRTPNGIRTRAAAVKGRSPWPLDDGG